MAQHAMDRERPDHTLQPTAIAHDAFLKLVDQSRATWQDRAHFFAIAATTMRRLLVDHARGAARLKRRGGKSRVPLDNHEPLTPPPNDDLLALDEALRKLAELDPRTSRIVEMRHFGGMTNGEIAAVLDTSERTVERGWEFARAWLRARLGGDGAAMRDGAATRHGAPSRDGAAEGSP